MADDGIHGALLSLTTRTMGDAFLSSATIGTTTLALTDVSDFDEDGGQVIIAGSVYTYDSANMAADTIHLTSGLGASAAVGDRVDIWDADTAAPVTEMTALVSVDNQDGDPVTASVDHSLTPLLANTTYAAGQSVSIKADGAGHLLTRVHGKNNQALQRSTLASVQFGIDDNAGNVFGIAITPGGSIVRASTQGDFRVKTPDGLTFMPILASAFNMSPGGATMTSGSGAPGFSATKGDIYFRTDTPTTANQRIYINTTGSTTWLGIV